MARREIEYRITADSKGLTTALDKVKPAVDAAAKATERASKSMVAGLASFGLALDGLSKIAQGLAAPMRAVQQGMEGINHAAQKASAFGVTVRQYEGLRLAAESVGATFDDLRGVIGNFSKNDDLRAPIDQIKELADEIAKVGPGARATQMAVQAFGETGINLLPVLLQGRQGFEEMEAAAERFGLVVDEKAQAAAARMASQLQEMRERASGLARTLAAELLPALNDYLDLLLRSEGATKGLDLAVKAISTGVKAVVNVIDALGVAVSFAVRNIEYMAEQLAQTFLDLSELVRLLRGGDIGGVGALWERSRQALKANAARFLGDQKQLIDEAATRWAALWGDGDGETVGPTLDMLGGEKTVAATKATAGKVEDLVAKHLRELSRIRGEYLGAMAEVDWILEDAADALDQAERFGEELAQQWRDAAWEAGEQRVAAWKAQLDEELAAQQEASAEQIEQYQKTTQQLKSISDTVGRAIGDALFGPATESLDDLLRRWGEAIARMAITAGVTAAIGGDVGAAFGFAGGGLVPGFGTGRGDGVQARLSGGEYVMSADAVDRHGKAFFDRLNGMVGGGGGSEVVVVAPSTEQELERLLASKRGQRIIMATVSKYGR